MKNLFKHKQTTNKDNLDMPIGIEKQNYLQMKIAGFNLSSKTIKASLLMVSLGLSIALNAKENIPGSGGNSGSGHRNNGSNNGVMAGCIAGTTQQEISLNNVRTRILTDGDMWWDFASSIAKYEIPKGSNSYAMFAGSLWFGGFVNGNLRTAAMTYRQNGVDFWPGPLNPVDLSIDVPTCQAYDKVWQFNRSDVASFYSYWLQYNAADPATPTWIKDYPGNSLYPGNPINIPSNTYYNNLNASLVLSGSTAPLNYLAPYVDVNGDGTYNYANGDYPAYNVSGAKVARGHCVRYLFGDVTNFWVFNDNANKHTETGSLHNIGVEVRGQAFEFSTNDELNDMTFYNYEIINWSTNTLTQAYFTVWADCDLGNYQDDYVGCDVSRGLGYQYNGDNYDEDVGGQTGYHDKLPAIGCDFFQGPYADLQDGIDNDRDGCVDCSWSICADGKFACPPAIADNATGGFPEQCIMSRFTYYNNTSSTINGNPTTSAAYYDLMSGIWESGVPMTYGQLGQTTPASAANPACKFLFPGDSDPLGWGLGYHPNGTGAASTPGIPIAAPAGAAWTEASISGNNPGDRRFMQSAGPFTLVPGAVNYVTFGLPFARSNSNNNLEPIPLMEAADDKAQSLFDNCFKVLDGPDAPDLTIQELSQQFLITLTNNPYTSNNYEAKRYADIDPSISFPLGGVTGDKVYRFEGYKVYQLLDGTISVSDLYNTNLARLVFQCDIKNGISQIINYNTDPTLGLVPQVMVAGTDGGIQNSFSLTQDQFAVSDKRLVNFKNYYFMAVSYAYNNFLTYKPDVAPTGVATQTTVLVGGVTTNTTVIVSSNPVTGDTKGQKKPYLQGRNNVKSYTAIPHSPAPEAYGTVLNSSYGGGPQVTRIEGQGNGGYALDLTDASIADILNPANNNRVQKITYVAGRTPILVKVTDPLRVVKGDFTVKFVQASKQPTSTGGVTWYYSGNAPVANSTTLDTGKVKNIDTLKWFMTGTYTDLSGNKVTKTWLSDEGLSTAQEKIITGLNNEPLGFSINIKQSNDPQITAKYTTATGTISIGGTNTTDLLESSISFNGSSWLVGIPDIDGSPLQDWILSGNTGLDIHQHDPVRTGASPNTAQAPSADPSSVWETVVGGTWAPFRFASSAASSTAISGTSYVYNYPNYIPSFGGSFVTLLANMVGMNSNHYADTRLLSSVDVVFTNDQSKWTRCPVIDMSMANDPSTSMTYKWQLRRAKSVDKNGTTAHGPDNNDYDSSMSWFPGYAINIETGERLNMIFSENSSDVVNNGNDMMWNPTSQLTSADVTGTIITSVNGGMHYVYVLGHNSDGNFTIGNEVIPSDVRRYDGGKSVYQMLTGLLTCPRDFSSMSIAQKSNKFTILAELFKDIMWTSMPTSSVALTTGHQNGGTQITIPNDAKVKIRVIKPFRYGLSTVTSPANTSFTATSTAVLGAGTGGLYTYTNTPLNSNTFNNLPADVVSAPQNGNFPMYTFSTNDLAPSTYQVGTAQAALAMINVVPNPYYAHSTYEQKRIDLEIKIINLPVKCTIKIYTLSGTLIRTLNKDNSDTYLTWDLHNGANIQIASGLYIMHIDAPGIGERIIKWFGVMRPYDLQSY